jgi:hypothetical protein
MSLCGCLAVLPSLFGGSQKGLTADTACRRSSSRLDQEDLTVVTHTANPCAA